MVPQMDLIETSHSASLAQLCWREARYRSEVLRQIARPYAHLYMLSDATALAAIGARKLLLPSTTLNPKP